jgi:hypothetical protein
VAGGLIAIRHSILLQADKKSGFYADEWPRAACQKPIETLTEFSAIAVAMILSRRQELILSRLDEILSPAHLLRSPFLASRVCHFNRIPISELCAIPSIVKLRATEAEVSLCCAYSRYGDVVEDLGVLAVVARSCVDPSILVLCQAAQSATVREIGDFVRLLGGDTRFATYVPKGGADCVVRFDHPAESIAVWRAMALVPFKGRLLDIRAYAWQPIMTSAQPATPQRWASQTQLPKIKVARPECALLDLKCKREAQEV